MPEIILVQFPTPTKKVYSGHMYWRGSVHGITRQCKKCGNAMWCNPHGEIKTLAPPLYMFQCMCGRKTYAHIHPWLPGPV